MSEFKYIVVENSVGYKAPIIFPDILVHSIMAASLKKQGWGVISAGFVKQDDNGEIFCTGYSNTLNVSSRPKEDSELIHQILLGLPYGLSVSKYKELRGKYK